MITDTLSGKPASRRFEAVIFDLDGTLLDTLADLADSVNQVLASYGFPLHSHDSYRFRVGNGVRKMVERSLPPGKAELLDEAVDRQKAIYELNCTRQTQPYPGLMSLLGELQGKGVKMAVLSNKHHPFTVRLVQHYFPAGLFTVILGQRPDVPLKPDPASALEAARLMGVDPNRTAFVGDSAMDMQTARSAGMTPIGVLWGFRPEVELVAAGAEHLAKNYGELEKLINHLN